MATRMRLLEETHTFYTITPNDLPPAAGRQNLAGQVDQDRWTLKTSQTGLRTAAHPNLIRRLNPAVD